MRFLFSKLQYCESDPFTVLFFFPLFVAGAKSSVYYYRWYHQSRFGQLY